MKQLLSCSMVNLLGLVVFVGIVAFPASAQETTGEVHGRVTESNRGEPLIGANVVLVGTAFGGITNLEGEFSLKRIPPGTYVIRARYVGYREQSREISITAGRPITIDFSLDVTAVQMDEIIVTGQGAAIERRKLSTAVETISSRELNLAPVKSIDQLLQGRVTGLNSFSPSGLPGTGARIQTRGIKSVVLSSTPVIYVDGVRVDNNDNFRLAFGTGGQVSSALADLVTGEIDHVEIIKGGASSTLFGSEAANGVIQIFTKKGTPGEARWRFNVTSGFDAPENKFTLEEYTKDKFYRTSPFQSYTANVNGGTETFSYNVSGKMFDSRGIVVNDKLSDKQYNISTGMRALLSQTSDVEVSASYTRSQFGRIFNDNSTVAPLSALELEGNFRRLEQRGGDKDSLLRLLLLADVKEVSNRFITSTSVNYKPVEGWVNKFTLGLDYRKSEERQYSPIEGEKIGFVTGGFLSASHREFLTITMAYNSSYVLPSAGPVDQTLSVGAQGFRVEDRENFGRGRTFRIPGTTDFDNASTIDAQESNRQLFSGGFFVNDQIGLWNRIFLDLGIRFDGNSTFGKEIGIQTYPKAGVAYNVSEEDFYPEVLKPYLTTLKLRASWGQTGNFPAPFTRDRQYTSNVFLSESAITFNIPGDQTLKPEKTSSVDVGFDAGLFGDRVSLEFNYFSQVTKDALFNVATDPASGFNNPQQRNVGEISNKGIEVALRANLVATENFEMNTRISFATLSNKVESLGGTPAFSIAGFAFAPQRVEEGYPVGVFRVNVPRLESDGTYQGNSDPVLMGAPTPKQTGSVSMDMTIFRDFTITGLLEFALGHQVLNQGISRRIVNSSVANPLYPEDFAKLPVSTNPANPYTRNTASVVLLEDADWFKLREISLRYRLPRWIFQGLTLTASARNVAVFGTKTRYADPELSFIRAAGQLEVGSIVGANPSPPKQFRFGLDVAL